MTLLPANFGASQRESDPAFENKRGGEKHAGAAAAAPVSAAVQKPENTPAVSRAAAGVKDLSRISVSEDGRLYWDGKPVVVRRRIKLSPWQTFGVILIALAALMIALSGAVHVTITAHDWMCRANWATNCPAPLTPPAAPPMRPELPN